MLKPIQRISRTAFSSASTLPPSIPFTRSDLSARLPTVATKNMDEESHTSANAFASSGFAALAGSSTSPFGTLGGSSTTAIASPFASAGASSSGKTETGKEETQSKETAAGGGFGAFVNSSSTGFGATDRSPFATSGSNKTGIFGGSVFGSAFGGPFGGGNRLTSFAAPTGNAKLGATNGAIKPIGSPKHEGDDDNSESDGDVSADNRKDEETEEADGRFQHQDGRRKPPLLGSKADRDQSRLVKAAKSLSSLRELAFTRLGTTLGRKAARVLSSSTSPQHLQRTLLQTEKRDAS